MSSPEPHSVPPPVPTKKGGATRTLWRNVRRKVIVFAIVPYLAVGFLAVLVQRDLLYVPARRTNLAATTVQSAGIIVEDLKITTDDQLTLNGWRIRRSGGRSSPQTQVFLYFPGNGGCRIHRLDFLREIVNLGYEAVIFDYRGYGENPGKPSEARLAHDARQAWDLIVSDLKIPAERIVIFGESMGGGVATRLVGQLCAEKIVPGGLVLQATFSSMGDVVAWHIPAYPFRYVLWDQFDSQSHIAKVTCPILQFHGTDDQTVPHVLGQKLFAAAPVQSQHGIPKRFVTLSRRGHNDISFFDKRLELSTFLRTIRDHERKAP